MFTQHNAKSLFQPEALVTGGFRSAYRTASRLDNTFECLWDHEDAAYCLDAPEAMAAGAMVCTNSFAKPSTVMVYRKSLA